MRKTIFILSVLFIALSTHHVYAEQTRETQVCAAAIEKASAKFYKKVYSSIRVCLKAVSACAGDQTCIGNLLVLDKGKCAAGKLDEGVEYFGNTSSQYFALETNQSRIGKAHYKFVEALGKRCFVAGVDLSNGPDGLGFNPAPANKFELGDVLNKSNTTGVACSAHHDLLNEFPNRDALTAELIAHPNFTNVAIGVAYIYYPTDCR